MVAKGEKCKATTTVVCSTKCTAQVLGTVSKFNQFQISLFNSIDVVVVRAYAVIRNDGGRKDDIDAEVIPYCFLCMLAHGRVLKAKHVA